MDITLKGTYEGHMPSIKYLTISTYRGIELNLIPATSYVEPKNGKFEVRLGEFIITDDEGEILFPSKRQRPGFLDILMDAHVVTPKCINMGMRQGKLDIKSMNIEGVKNDITLTTKMVSYAA